jgi:hypothetical protein
MILGGLSATRKLGGCWRKTPFHSLTPHQVASYLGLVPGEESSGSDTSASNTLLRFLLVEAAQVK